MTTLYDKYGKDASAVSMGCVTGRIYLGPIVTCLIFIMILITNTVIYIPV